jgi:hypothetical protein
MFFKEQKLTLFQKKKKYQKIYNFDIFIMGKWGYRVTKKLVIFI